MRMACCAVLALSACYAPKVVGGAPCDPAVAESCPSGQSCVATAGGGGVCTVGGSGPDAGIDSGIPTDGGTCLGKGLLGSVCLSNRPTTPVSLSGSVSISTATVGGNSCSEIRAQSGGPSLCLVVATTITVAAGATVRATGPNPLVLVATQSITVNGTLDASSEPIAGAPVLGAGARAALECTGVSMDGTPGKSTGNVDDDGAGGGAGGSLGTLGGAGGAGARGNIAGGIPVMSAFPSVLVGGCPGGRGGNGLASNGTTVIGGGPGGNGGGSVYLLAGDSISVTGKINASGAGGTGGFGDNRSGGGGGGGGSGGMIGLEAPHITLMMTGSIYANGGGGGGGCGNDPGNQGQSGFGSTAALTAGAGGSSGSGGGGKGGDGSVGTTAPLNGQPSTNIPETGGGGGGGGAGIIRVFGSLAASSGSAVSPPPR